jgi:hypothetical protein
MPRTIASFLTAAVLTLLAIAPAAARQDATPMSGLEGLGLPRLDITLTADKYEGIPESTEAGRYLVSVTVGEDTVDGGVAFVQPTGMTADEFLAGLAGPGDVAGADASPEVMAQASPAEGGEDSGAPPPEYYQSKFAGGTIAAPGTTAQVVLDLTPGEWIAWGDNPEATQEPVIFEVTGEMPADLPEPESSATLTMAEYQITVTEGELTAGQQVIKIDNVGAQPHFIFAAKGPDSMTQADIEAILNADMTGTPPAVDFNPDTDLIPILSTGTQSLGTSSWLQVNLDPGTYVFACFFPDISDGLPHAYHGMYNVLQVAA